MWRLLFNTNFFIYLVVCSFPAEEIYSGGQIAYRVFIITLLFKSQRSEHLAELIKEQEGGRLFSFDNKGTLAWIGEYADSGTSRCYIRFNAGAWRGFHRDGCGVHAAVHIGACHGK